MCGRFLDPNLSQEAFSAVAPELRQGPRRFNVKPTQPVLLFDAAGRPALARWGLVPSWHRGALRDWRAATFNARLEEAEAKPSFRDAFRHGRCLIPIGGYYEWTGSRSSKQPHVILSAGNDDTLWCAGLAAVWQEMLSCAIVTRAAGADTAMLHERMPVLLTLEEREAWLRGAAPGDMGLSVRLRHYPVARFGLEAEGEELIEPLSS